MLLEYLRRFPDNEGSECTFSNLYIWAKGNRVEWAIEDDTLLIHTYSCDTPCLMMAFCDPCGLERGICAAIAFMGRLGEEFRMCSLPEWYVRRMQERMPGKFVYTREEHHDDYVYETESMISLAGRDLHAKRNHINKFNNMFRGRYEYQPYDTSMFADCMDAYFRWYEEQGAVEELDLERDSVERALRCVDPLGLKAAVIRVDGKVEAFTVGEKITNDMALIHIEKANYNVQGLFSVINQMFLENTFSGLKWVNREEDMGIEGLRRAKRSYKPARMVLKYGATLA